MPPPASKRALPTTIKQTGGPSRVHKRAKPPITTINSANRPARAQTQRRSTVLISELEHRGYEAAARCLAEDLDALVVHLRYPLRHRERWRSTNLLERSLGEVRRRTKVMGRFPGESSCLSLVFAVLDLFIAHASNGATFTELDANTSTESNTDKPTPTPSTRRSQPHRLTPREPQSRSEFTAVKRRNPCRTEMHEFVAKQDRSPNAVPQMSWLSKRVCTRWTEGEGAAPSSSRSSPRRRS